MLKHLFIYQHILCFALNSSTKYCFRICFLLITVEYTFQQEQIKLSNYPCCCIYTCYKIDVRIFILMYVYIINAQIKADTACEIGCKIHIDIYACILVSDSQQQMASWHNLFFLIKVRIIFISTAICAWRIYEACAHSIFAKHLSA